MGKIGSFGMKVRVYYEDTDIGGVVYYDNYFKFIERARSDFFFSQGVMPVGDGAHFVVRHIEADFLASATLGDELVVKNSLVDLKGASFRLLQEVWLEENKLFTAVVTLAFVSQGRATKIPLALREIIEQIPVKGL